MRVSMFSGIFFSVITRQRNVENSHSGLQLTICEHSTSLDCDNLLAAKTYEHAVLECL